MIRYIFDAQEVTFVSFVDQSSTLQYRDIVTLDVKVLV